MHAHTFVWDGNSNSEGNKDRINLTILNQPLINLMEESDTLQKERKIH